MQTITIDKALPVIFTADSDKEPVCSSQVWLRKVVFNKGESVLVTAESGTGKTSLCNFVYGVRHDYSGSIRFDDTDARSLDAEQWCALRSQHLAYLPQEMMLFGELTVMGNILLKNSLTDRYSEAEIRAMLDRLEIVHKADTRAGLLSIGQMQRVALVRALCQPIDFLLLDEPVSHLDARNNTLMASLVNDTAVADGAGVIVTSVGNHLSLNYQQTLKL